MKTTLHTTARLLLTAAAGLLLNACASTGSTSAPSTAAAPAAGVKPYPLKTCLVTGNDLGSMGDQQRIVYEGRELKFCCQPCVGKFKKNPAKYLTKLP